MTSTKRFATLALAATIIAGATAPTLAAPRVKRAPVVQAEPYYDPAPARLRPVMPPNWNPNACWSDEGYGRLETCAAAGM